MIDSTEFRRSAKCYKGPSIYYITPRAEGGGLAMCYICYMRVGGWSGLELYNVVILTHMYTVSC